MVVNNILYRCASKQERTIPWHNDGQETPQPRHVQGQLNTSISLVKTLTNHLFCYSRSIVMANTRAHTVKVDLL